MPLMQNPVRRPAGCPIGTMSGGCVVGGLSDLVRSRGLTLGRFDPIEGLLHEASRLSAIQMAEYLELLGSYAARLILREAIKSETPDAWSRGRRSIERFCSPLAFDRLLGRFLALGILVEKDGAYRPERPVTSFGPTYEWYVSQVLESRFGCEAVWGATLTGETSGGDHDVIAGFGGRLLYMEIKTAPPKHVDAQEIEAFISRVVDIAPDIAVLHEDTHLRMKDKIVPLMEEAIYRKAEQGGTVSFHLERLEREIFTLNGAIYVVNSKPDLERNLTTVFRDYFRRDNRVLAAMSKP